MFLRLTQVFWKPFFAVLRRRLMPRLRVRLH
jgi:hypothetical protein